MALSRARKQEILDVYGGGLAKATHAFLLSYKGVSVPQVTELRSRVRQKGGKYLVVKNTLALRAVAGGALKALESHFTGPTAVVYGDDPVAIAKALHDFIKDVPAFEFKVGLVDGQIVAGAQIKELATLPSREELIAKLLFLLQSPITRFVRVLAAVPQQFVGVLDQIRVQKEKQGS
jgi:large subunit ribosomal protein L10